MCPLIVRKKEERPSDMLDLIVSYVENRSHARETPEVYLSYLYQLLELYSEYKEGHEHVMPGKSREYKERVGELVLQGMNEFWYKIKINYDESQRGKLNVAPEFARLVGGQVTVNDLISLQVVPDSRIKDPFTLIMYYRDAIKIFGTYANKGEEIEGKLQIKKQEIKEPSKRLSIDKIKELTTYKDRVSQS